MELEKLSIREIHRGLTKKEFSALELTERFLDIIGRKDKELSAYLAVSADSAVFQAKKVDEMISRNQEIPLLAGVPMAIKDNILAKDAKTTCASKILERYIAPYDATAVKKIKDRGAVILGRTNLDEFAMGASTENSAFFTTKNPADLTRVPGGSSGGPAAAVAAGMAVCALGSDTGGSIRQPASFCGVVGLKPTYGAVSRYGLVAYASSLDQIGPIAKTVEDAEITFNAIKGKDEMDMTSVELNFKSQIPSPKSRQVEDPRSQSGQIPNPKSQIKNLTIGVPKEYFVKGIDGDVEKTIRNAIRKIEELGAKIIEINLPHAEYALPAYYLIATSEASANLARYDGIRYGLSEQKKNLLEVYLESRAKGFGAEVKRRIMLGTYALSAGYYDAYYLKAQKARTLLKKDFDDAFLKVDAIFTPVSPTPAFKIGEKITDPLSMYLTDIFTVSVNLVGLPAVSVPVGFGGKLPIGLQIIGRPFEENKILGMAKIYE